MIWVLASVIAISLAGCSASADRYSSPAPIVHNPNEETMLAVGACLEERGWEVTDASTGDVKVAPEQVDVFNRDFDDCTSEVQGDAEYTPMTGIELEAYYPLVVREAECLRAAGYDMQIPTLQVYKDTFEQTPFVPRAEVGPFSQSESERLDVDCPPADWAPRTKD